MNKKKNKAMEIIDSPVKISNVYAEMVKSEFNVFKINGKNVYCRPIVYRETDKYPIAFEIVDKYMVVRFIPILEKKWYKPFAARKVITGLGEYIALMIDDGVYDLRAGMYDTAPEEEVFEDFKGTGADECLINIPQEFQVEMNFSGNITDSFILPFITTKMLFGKKN